jgi:hypothetical protein
MKTRIQIEVDDDELTQATVETIERLEQRVEALEDTVAYYKAKEMKMQGVLDSFKDVETVIKKVRHALLLDDD